MKSRYNDILVGLVLGLLVPWLGFLVVYLFAFRGMSFRDYVELLVYHRQLSAVISLSVIPNLLLFFIFIWLNYLYSARGVLAATLIFAGIVVATKFLI